jgi:hypothetical protein
MSLNIDKIAAIIVTFGTSFLGYSINQKAESWCPFIWSIIDGVFWPLAWLKWLICHQVNLSVVKEAFGFFLK